MKLLLVGNPNCGKTTLFNALTGERQKVGNWPGVTVEKKSGFLMLQGQSVEVTDLPGIYSLASEQGSLDEQIAMQAVISMPFDCIINVVDACHLNRHLYLTSQLLEAGKPMILVLTMMDIAKQRGIEIDRQALAGQLGCPVIALQAHKGIGLQGLMQQLTLPLQPPALPKLTLPPLVLDELAQTNQDFGQQMAAQQAYFMAMRTLETRRDSALELDLCLAEARYQLVQGWFTKAVHKRQDLSPQWTEKLDKILLNRWLALPCFFALMYAMFCFAIQVGGFFQDYVDSATDWLFVSRFTDGLEQLHAPGWLIAILANGLGRGLNTTLTFVPVIAAMFFFLSLLEASGYMARAAFVVDRLMRWLGLPGKSFVPMIVGFGCNVPAIMAARTLDSERDRLLTILMTPFMSCSARLAIYAVFVAAFFPTGGQNVVFSLYLLGILMAVATGFLLRKTHLKGQAAPLILELPAYHRPQWRRVYSETLLRLRFFIWRAGTLIIPVCILLGALNALTWHGEVSLEAANADSILSWLGQCLTPLFAPMGISPENWPATVSLLTGMLAKEVVVGSLNALYGQLGQTGAGMAQHFDGQAGAYAYLIFTLLYVPCVSTMAVIKQEANKPLMWFSVLWSLILAYGLAVLFYQIARFSLHPGASLMAIGLVVLGLMISIQIIKRMPKLLQTSPAGCGGSCQKNCCSVQVRSSPF